MKKILISLIILIIAIPIAGLIAINFLIEPNDFKPMIIEKTHQTTGGELTINGDIAWSFFPSIGLRVADLSFKTENGVNAPMMTLDNAHFSIALLPLLKGSVNVGGINISDAELWLLVDKNGDRNWDFLTKEQSNVPAAPKDNTTTQPPEALSFNAETIALSNIVVHYQNLQEKSSVTFGPLNVASEDVSFNGKRFPLHIDFDTTINNDELQINFTSDIELSIAKNQDITLYKSNSSVVIKGEATNGKKANIQLLASGSYTEGNNVELSIKKLSIENLVATADISARDLNNKPSINGNFAIPLFNVQELLNRLGQETIATRNPDALTAVSIKGDIAGPANSALIKNLQLTLDDTTFTGEVGLSDISSQAMVLNLTGTTLNADDYLPPVAAEKTTTKKSDTTPNTHTASEPNDLPIESLKELLFTSNLQIQKMIINGLTLSNLSVKSQAHGGVLSVKQASANLYNGSLEANASFDMRGKSPHLTLSSTVKKVQLKPLLTHLNNTKSIDGLANFNAQLTSQGRSPTELVNHINGPASFIIEKLHVDEVNLERNVCQAIAYARNKELNGKWPSSTQFESIWGQIHFTDGVGISRNIQGGLSNMKLLSDLEVNLPKSTFNAGLRMRITGDLQNTNEACVVNERYRSVDWPLRCQGSFASNSQSSGNICRFDSQAMGGILEDLAKAEAKHAVEKELNKKYSEELNILKGLFKKND